jgi:O-antigen/teichoic acid export membrane protein
MLWGLVDQGSLSAANFALTVAAARLLGPAGLGRVFVGFTFFLFALSLQRALISDPLVVASARLSAQERREATRAATTATVSLATGMVLLTCAAGLVLPAGVGGGLVLYAPWIAPAMLHELFRTALFRDQRGAEGARNAVASLIVIVAAMAVTTQIPSDRAVVGAWGLGGLTGAMLGIACTRAWPTRPAAAWRWWRGQAWPLGRWLGAESLVINGRLQLYTLLLAGVLGTTDLGGLRAAESLFALMTLVGPALGVAGLPATTRALERSVSDALRLASRISGIALAVVALYLAGVGIARSEVMGLVFGREFVAFAHLVIPIGVAQLLGGGVLGYNLFLKACSAGRALFRYQVAFSILVLSLSVGLAVRYGAEGAAWGYALACLLAGGLMVLLAFREGAGRRDDAKAVEPAVDG